MIFVELSNLSGHNQRQLTAHSSHWNESPRVVSGVLEISRSLGGFKLGLYGGWLSTSQLYSWKTVRTDVAICGQALSWRMITRSSICELSNFRPQNFAKEVYIHMLVHCMTIWHCICGNYVSIIVSYYYRSFHLWSLTLDYSLQKHNYSFFLGTNQMFLTPFHTMLCLCRKQHTRYQSRHSLFLH